MPTTTSTKTLRVVADWHQAMAEQLANPILPTNLPQKELEQKKRQIDRQKEKHQKFARALRALIAKQKS